MNKDVKVRYLLKVIENLEYIIRTLRAAEIERKLEEMPDQLPEENPTRSRKQFYNIKK